MQRITNDDLKRLSRFINEASGNPLESYAMTREPDGRKSFQANVGNFHISGAYGGVCLHRIITPSGGVRDVFKCGHITKRELYVRMLAFLEGMETR